MIHIDTTIFDMEQIKRAYRSAPGSVVSSQNGMQIARDSVISKVRDKISSHLRINNPQNAEMIVTKLLKQFFGSDPDNVSEDDVEQYLFRVDFYEIIQFFWCCVSQVWIDKLLNEGIRITLSKEDVIRLIRWEGTRERAVEEKDLGKRIAMVTEVITPKLLPFFAYITGKDLDKGAKRGTYLTNKEKLKKVKFRYHDDLYNKSNGAFAILSNIFDYDFLRGAPRHQLMSAMHIPVCPYCNRQYITAYCNTDEGTANTSRSYKKGNHKTTADLDHFYCKSRYPYLSLSIYNFVPSCQLCNSRFKIAKDFYDTPHLYPYDRDPPSEAIFKITDLDLLMNENAWEKGRVVEIETTGEAAENSVRTFHLREVYESHKDYIHEIVIKTIIYNTDRIQSLLSDFPDIFSDEKQVRSLIFGQYIDELDVYKRPLAKLTRDILKECNYLK